MRVWALVFVRGVGCGDFFLKGFGHSWAWALGGAPLDPPRETPFEKFGGRAWAL